MLDEGKRKIMERRLARLLDEGKRKSMERSMERSLARSLPKPGRKNDIARQEHNVS